MTYAPLRAPRGPHRTAKGWIQEAAKRMLMNNLDPEVAEHPESLVVYGGRGKAARNWQAYHDIIATLDRLENDETLLIQSGKPVAVLKTHAMAPRVLLANSNLVPKWATWEEFDRLDQLGLMMYGQMTAGSWIYIGTQGILQGTYETFASAGAKHFGGSLAGTITVTAGLGGMGGAQPLAVTLAGGVAICIEVDQSRIERRLETRYLDVTAASLDDALRMAREARSEKRALSIGLLGNAAEIVPEMVRMGFTPDLVTDQTSAHDPMWGYLPPVRADEDLDGTAQHAAGRVPRAGAGGDGRACPGDHHHAGARRDRLRLRQQPARAGRARRPRRRDDGLSGLRAGLHPRFLLRGARPVPLGRALGRSRRHRRHRHARCSSSSPTTSGCRSGSAGPATRSPSRGSRLASAGSAIASATRPACSSTRWCATAA